MSNKQKPIVLKAKPALEDTSGVVRLTPEAQIIVRRLHYMTNLPVRQIVSQIIIQAENLIDAGTTWDTTGDS